MKRAFLLIGICMLHLLAYGQGSFKAEYSEPFEEPAQYNQRLILCKNKNTLLLSPREKEAIEVTVYDASHKPLKKAEITAQQLGFGKIRVMDIRQVHNIGDEVVAFVEARIRNGAPVLVRAHISPTDGSLTRKEQVGLAPAQYLSQGRAANYVDVAQYYKIVKDPHSDAYAVGTYFDVDLEGAALPYVVHYSGRHEEVGRYPIAPVGRYVFSKLEEMYVNGDKELWLATCPYNNGKGGTQKGSAVVLSRLRAGGDTASVMVTRLAGKDPAAVWLAYNPTAQSVHLLARYLMSSGHKSSFGPGAEVMVLTYAAQLYSIDGNSLTEKYGKGVNYALLDKVRRTTYGISDKYEGLPGHLTVGRDGIVRLVLANGGLDFGILEYDAEGQASNVHYFRKRTPGDGGFFLYEYLDTKQGQYVFVNDNAANLGRDKTEAPRGQRGATNSDALYYHLSNGERTESYLFGKGDATFDHRFANFNVTSYNEDNDTYAAMIVEQNGGKKKARIAWLQLQ